MMKRLGITKLFSLSIFCLLVVGCSPTETDIGYKTHVKVMLAQSDLFDIVSQNPVDVEIGKNVSFKINRKNDKKIRLVSPNIIIEKDEVIVRNCYYPSTIHLEELEDDELFIGWSKDRDLKSGGELVATNEVFNPLTKGTYVANYANASDTVIQYNLNGGTYLDSDTSFYDLFRAQEYYLSPNTLPSGKINRDGYTLVGYEDSDGCFINLGGFTTFFEHGIHELSCLWEKWTDPEEFTYIEKDNGCFIDKYNGHDSKVVIPANYQGKDIVGISSSAFNSSEITKVVLSDNIKVVEESAFKDCTNLESFVMTDGVDSITMNSFENSPFKNIVVNAKKGLAFIDNFSGAMRKKLTTLNYFKDNPLLLVIAGSSCRYGFDAPYVNSKQYKYRAINLGLTVQVCIPVYLSYIAQFLGDDDIVIHAAEYAPTQQYTTDMEYYTWASLECSYNVLNHIDCRKFDVFFGYNSYSKAKNLGHFTYDTNCSTESIYGDLQINITEKKFVSNKWLILDEYNVRKYPVEKLNVFYHEIEKTGSRMYLSSPPFDFGEVYFCNDEGFLRAFHAKTTIEYISIPSTYFFNEDYFYDSCYHLLTAYRYLYNDQLLADLNSQLIKEGLPGLYE